MKIIAPKDTIECLGTKLEKLTNRSLFYERFADPRKDRQKEQNKNENKNKGKNKDNKQDERDEVYNKLIGLKADPTKCHSFNLWIHKVLLGKSGRGKIIYARQQSRLMVNMSGGVMENAGICLDRTGMPYIPGSAVKGCARRMAIQELYEDRCSGKDIKELANKLVKIATIFGWGEQDWSNEKNTNKLLKSDFTYAVGLDKLIDVFNLSCNELVSRKILSANPKTFKDFGAFSGRVSFLPAYPVDINIPNTLGKLELDVITCHHQDYYSGNKEDATDDEDPNPVKFPAVAEGHIFGFALIKIRECSQEDIEQAGRWLLDGLINFGIGAKTAAGYGWFQDVTNEVKDSVKRLYDEENKKGEELRKKQEEEKELEKLPPEERFKIEYLKLLEDKFAEKAKNISKMNDFEKKGFLLALKDNKKKDTVKRWKKKKQDNINPWIDYGKTLNPPIDL